MTMAANSIPEGGISLIGPFNGDGSAKTETRSAILLKLSDQVLNDLRKASISPGGVEFVMGGKAPKLRIGNRSIDLNLSPERFRTELYTSSIPNDLTFSSVVSHRAITNADMSGEGQTTGTDEALAALKSSMEMYEQEKKATQTQVANAVLPMPKNRWDAAKQQKRGLLGVSHQQQPSSPSLSATASPRLAPASSFVNSTSLRAHAMRTSLTHLLAVCDLSTSDIAAQTYIPKKELDSVLQGVGQQKNEKWQLSDKMYRDLDVWKFRYKAKEDRQSAIDNAVRAYDRLRLGKDDNLWQLLLPKQERGKGKVLSRLLSAQSQTQGLTPSYNPSPNPHTDCSVEAKVTSAATTPRLGPAGTPTLGATKANNGGVMKRLLSKNPKQARATEKAKELKRKERQTAVDDRESHPAKRLATASGKKGTPTHKSAEFIESSDEDAEEGEVKPTSEKVKSHDRKDEARTHTIGRSPALKDSHRIHSQDHPKTPAHSSEKLAPSKPKSTNPARSPALHQSKPTGEDKTSTKVNGLTAPSPQQKPQLSPSKSVTRPSVPSPLGAARSRLASDVSDRSGIGITKRIVETETPKGLGITTGTRKRHDTVTSTEGVSAGKERVSAHEKALQNSSKPEVNGNPTATNKSSAAGSVAHKRKAEDLGPQDMSASKQRKTVSTPSQTHPLNSSMSSTENSTARTSPDERFDGGSSDSSASVINSITFNQGVALAQKFQEQYYPQYAKLYDLMAERQGRGETISVQEKNKLWEMHERLSQMKREVEAASRRQHRGGES